MSREQLAALRKELNGLVGAWSHRTGQPHGVIHNELRNSCGGPALPQASAEQIRARIDKIRQWALSRRLSGLAPYVRASGSLSPDLGVLRGLRHVGSGVPRWLADQARCPPEKHGKRTLVQSENTQVRSLAYRCINP